MHKYNAKIAFNLHFLSQRKIVLLTLLSIFSIVLNGQEIQRIVTDSLSLKPDTIFSLLEQSMPSDSLQSGGRKISDEAVEMPIIYSASPEGYMKTDVKNKKVSLVKNAQVKYGTIELTADSIVLDMETGSVYATGLIDSTGKMTGKPRFKDKSQQFESRELTYNFKTKKGVIRNVTTEEEGGYLQSLVTKRHEDESLHIYKSKFTTCDKENPDFYLALNKAKVYPGEKIVSGPAYMVVADIPLPVILPFGFFPVQQKRASGIIMPKYGQEANRGYYLSDGGYYFAINDYFDLRLTGTLYTNMTWLASAATTYKVKYRFSGNFAFSYANNVTGYKGDPEYGKNSNYRINWSHSQDSKANPGSRFSASVSMSSSGYDKNNSYNVSDHVTTTRQSSISYSKSWAGSPYNFSASLYQSQNVQNKTMTLNLPKAEFSVARFYPLKPKKPALKKRWYHDLQMQYSSRLENRINTYDSLLFTNQVWENMDNGFMHEIPMSVQIRPFNNFSISPQMKYTGVMYTRKIERNWDPDYFDTSKNDTVPSFQDSVTRGIYYVHALNPSVSMSYNPQIFGQFNFKNSRLLAIRHVVRPSVGFSYVPAMAKLASDMYADVKDTVGVRYFKYQGVYQPPSLGTESGSVSFSLANIVEAKVFAKNDSTGKPRKIKLIENLSFSTNYNLFKESMKWAPISMSFRTTLAENISIQASSSFSIYGLDSLGKLVPELAISQGRGLARMTGFNMSLNMDVGELLKGKKGTQTPSSTTSGPTTPGESFQMNDAQKTPAGAKVPLATNNYDEYGYVRFDVPWSLRVAYNLSYSKPAFTSSINQTLSFSGNVRLTPKTALTYSSGYDFKNSKITMSTISITRDLHCWQMSFNWVPVGTLRSWNFTIAAKAGVLQDLKYERRKDYHENF